MTNKEKAIEISKKYFGEPNQIIAWQASMKMAQWKDEQYKEEKKELFGLVKMLKADETNQTIIEDLKAMLE